MAALAFPAAIALVLAASVLVAARLRVRAAVDFALAVYVVGFAEIVACSLALSGADALTRGSLLATLTGVAVALAATWRLGPRPQWPALRGAVSTFRSALEDPLLRFLAIAGVVGLAYVIALAVGTPQDDADALFYHLARAAFWKQQHAIAYVHGIADQRVNSNPVNGEIPVLDSMLTAGSDRFVGLVQVAALVATTVAVLGIGRRIGLSPRAALFGSLLVPTLPVFALQAPTALNDLTVASLGACSAALLLSGRVGSLALGLLALALAVGAKVTALFALPILLALILVAQPRRRWLVLLVAGAASAAAGAYWYAVNAQHTGTAGGGLERGAAHGAGSLRVLARVDQLAIDAFDVSGAVGADRYLFAIVAFGIAATGIAFAARHRSRAWGPLATGALTLAPFVVLGAQNVLLRAHTKVWLWLGHERLAFLDGARDPTRTTPMLSWYGPIGILLAVGIAVSAVRAVRRRLLRPATLVLIASPAAWLAIVAVAVGYADRHGRYFMLPVALSAATWGLAYRWRPVAWATAAVAATTLGLVLWHDEPKPVGIRLLERAHRTSVWTSPRWELQAYRPGMVPVLRFVEQHVPARASIALALSSEYPSYPFFGSSVSRRIDLVGPKGKPTSRGLGDRRPLTSTRRVHRVLAARRALSLWLARLPSRRRGTMPGAPERRLVGVERRARGGRQRQLLLGQPPAGGTKAHPELAIAEQPIDRGAERADVARGDEQSRLPVDDDVRKAADSRRDDRPPVRERLPRDYAVALAT